MGRLKRWGEAKAALASPVPEDVWPIPAGKRFWTMRSYSGTGVVLASWSRPDAGGYRFATRWVSFFGMPLLPTKRLYVHQSGTHYEYRTTRTTYQIHGQARLRPGEITRAYLCCWIIAPVFILGPAILIDNHVGSTIWFFAAIGITARAKIFYQRFLAPLYTPRWRRGS